MPRTILAHVNVQLPDESTLTASDIDAMLNGAIEVGREGWDLAGASDLEVAVVLVEEPTTTATTSARTRSRWSLMASPTRLYELRDVLERIAAGADLDICLAPDEAERLLDDLPPAGRKYLDVRYDVTDLDTEEIAALTIAASVQAEGGDGYPSVEVEAELVVHEPEEVDHAV